MAALAAAVFFGVDATVNRAVSADAEHKARDWADYFIEHMPELDRLIVTGMPDADQLARLTVAEKIGDVFRFKLFDSTGAMTLVSDEAAYANESASAREHSTKAADVLRTGVASIAVKDGTGRQNRPPLFVEAYVPIVDTLGNSRGVVEVYIDQTKTAALIKTAFAALTLGLALAAALVFGLPTIAFLLRSRQASEAKQRVEYLARYEPMTGLLNRASFTERLTRALEGGERQSLTVVFLDVDDFKTINDTHGHEAGDEFLKHVASCVTALCRAGDIVARPGGDEFTLALAGRDEAEVIALVEQLMQAVGRPILIRGKSVSGRLSAGIYMVDRAVDTMADAIHKADTALYQAKLDGRNAWRLFSDELESSMRARRELEQLIRETVEREGFELHYQPLMQADTGICAGFEALLRLPDGKGGHVPPVVCVPVIESMGLIQSVGKWVIEEATRVAATWPDPLFVSVNLSVKQFQDGSLVEDVRRALAASGLAAAQLELEITESMLMQNTESIGRQISELRATGVSIAMDDFGTGYSSLGYLWQFRFDKLKIDRSFISALDDNGSQAREILDTIIMLGHKLEMTVTAEGIETAYQADVLSSLSCDHFQGFHYGRPQPSCDIASFLLDNILARLPTDNAAAPTGKRPAAA